MTLAPADPIAAAVRGDPTAWAALLATHGPAVWGVCRRLSPEPEDAYQEIWEKVHRHLERFDPHGAGTLRSWLLTIAHRHLVDGHRRRGTRPTLVGIDAAVPVDPQTDARLHRHQQRARIEAALQGVADIDRRALVMYHLHEHSLAEIAESEGVPRGTIKSRLHRARRRLIDLLGAS